MVRSVASDLQVAGSGTLAGTVVNTGNRTVTDAVVVFESGGGVQPRETRYPVGTLEPGASTRFRLPATVSPDADAGPQFVTFRVRYRGQGEEVRVSDAIDAVVQVGPEQSFDVRNLNSTLQVGETGRISGTVVNTGNQTITDAAVVFATNQTSVQPRTRDVAVGTLEPGESAPFSFTADVPRTADPGQRPLLFQVRYRDAEDETRVSDPIDARVDVTGEQTFAIENVETTLRVGERGEAVVTLRNTGTNAVEDASLRYTGEGPLQPLSSEAAAGTLEPGESTRITYTFDVPQTADPGRRSLPFVVQYEGRDDEVRTSAPLTVQATVAGEQTFAVTNTSSTLRVDDTGTVTANVTNTGDIVAEDVVVTVQETGPTLVPRETTYAVGTLAPGESASAEFRFDVTADAEAGPRLLTFQVRYRGQGDQVQTSDGIDATAAVDPQRDEFTVAAVNATIPAGESEIVTLRVRNRENETLQDVRARLFVDDPLSSDNSEAFVPTLAPNETALLKFEVSSAAGVVPKQYPLLVDFTYEDESGETVLSDTYFVAVDVVEPPPRAFPVALPR
ncbi:NEW3 domain-containing protein [Haloarculaceae archaeon H-GB2-1]|nr:NEW3 domain-containing protein [Haloarculaceae archaeon H-GB2-1]